MSYNEIPDLKSRIKDLERRIRDMETAPRASHTAVDSGAITFKNDAGILLQDTSSMVMSPDGVTETIRVGQQFDGTYGAVTLGGPTPPTPSNPIVTPIGVGLNIKWDGSFGDDDTVAPMDFSRVEVHVSTEPEYEPWAGTLVGTIESPRGGEVEVTRPLVPHYVQLITRTTAGKPSTSSTIIEATPVPIAITDTDLDIDSIGGTTIFYNSVEPDPLVESIATGDLWLKTPENTSYRWDGDSWELVQDQGIGQALLDAQTAATLAATKSTVFSQDTAPTGLTVDDDGDLWVDTNDDNKLYTWDGSTLEWVPHQFGNSAIQPASLVASDVIATGTVTAALLEAILILGSTIVAGTPGAARIELTSSYLRKYDASNNIEVELPVGGSAIFSGVITGSDIVGATIQTALTGPRIILSPENNPSGVAGSLKFYTDSANEINPGFIHVGEDGSATWDYGFVEIRPPEFRRDSRYTGIIFESLRHTSDPLLDTSNLLLSASTVAIPGKLIINENIERYVGSRILYKGPSFAEICFGRDIYILDSSLASGFGSFADFNFYSGYEPTTSHPYFAWDLNTKRLLYTTNGTTWNPVVLSATETSSGIVELATNAETQTGTDTARAITPANLSARTATETRTGVVELATTAETIAGTDTTRAVTPEGLRADAQSKPIVSLGMSAARNYTTSATLQAMTWDAEDFDTHAMHSTVSNTSRLTCVKSGYYNITGKCTTAVTDVGWTILTLYKNGVAQPKIRAGYGPATGSYTRPLIAGLIYLNVNDYVELYLQSSAPSASAILIDESFFAAEFIRP